MVFFLAWKNDHLFRELVTLILSNILVCLSYISRYSYSKGTIVISHNFASFWTSTALHSEMFQSNTPLVLILVFLSTSALILSSYTVALSSPEFWKY